MSSANEKWENVLSLMRQEVTDYQFATWFKPLKPIIVGDNRMVFEFENKFSLTIMRQNYYLMLKNAVMISYGKDYQIDFVMKGENPIFGSRQEPESHASDNDQLIASMLNPKYTFDTFVVGASNRFAHAAALAVAELPADAYNPLFLYGGAGLGKTHLMHAIGHHIHRNNPNAKLLYITSENFTNQLINAITERTSQELRDRLRTVDVLMVDDIQFIAGKTATQEEFFHTFNELHGSGKQIIISSDRPPKEIPTLEERLRSRFEWGLIADIQKPDYETRIAILRKKAELEHIIVSDSVLHYIAEKIESNIRELEGSLTRINAMAQLSGGQITLDMAREALDRIMPAGETRAATPEGILKAVAEYFGVSEADILSQRRNREIAQARQVAMYLTREMTQLSTTRIGDLFGGRDHTTVMHACDKIGELIEKDDEIRRAVQHLKK
ncbi:MAG: chromosomal replication initiator protein DnaA [Clostridia bacterium]|nr:chromosomal replication initiator protein DnaA [Clostridia bacterium]